MDNISAALLDVIKATWRMTEAMGPYLLIGFISAGLLAAFVSKNFVSRHLGGRGMGSILRAAIIGVPVPLCSCSVIPVALSIRRQGAGRGATSAFLTATPQDGVDSIMATYSLLGPLFTATRVMTALVSGIFSGIMIEWIAPRGGIDNEIEGQSQPGGSSGVEGDNNNAASGAAQVHGRLHRFFRHGFIVLPRDIGRALLVGLVLSGIITAFLPPNFFTDYLPGGSWWALPAILVAAIPLYVCSTGSVPLVFALISAGLSPGAGLVYLVAGPATNTAAIAAMARMLGNRAMIVYLAALSLCAIGAGVVVNLLWVSLPESAMTHGGHLLPGWINRPAAIALLLLLLPSLFRRGGKKS